MRTLLDFEKPIAELESKLEDMKRLANENNVDVSDAVRTLNDNIEQLKKKPLQTLLVGKEFSFPVTQTALIRSIISNVFVKNFTNCTATVR